MRKGTNELMGGGGGGGAMRRGPMRCQTNEWQSRWIGSGGQCVRIVCI